MSKGALTASVLLFTTTGAVAEVFDCESIGSYRLISDGILMPGPRDGTGERSRFDSDNGTLTSGGRLLFNFGSVETTRSSIFATSAYVVEDGVQKPVPTVLILDKSVRFEKKEDVYASYTLAAGPDQLYTGICSKE